MTVQLVGLKETKRTLDALGKKIRKKVLRKSIRAGGAVALKAEKRMVPKRNRGLQKSLIQKVKTYPNGNVVAMAGQDVSKVTSGKNKRKRIISGGISGRGDIVPIHLVESPTAAHDIAGNPLVFMASGGMPGASAIAFSRRVRHPGTKGSRFVQRARQSSAAAVHRAVEKKMTEEIARIKLPVHNFPAVAVAK